MDDFINEDDLHTLDGFLRYQAIDPKTISPDELKMWQDIFDENLKRAASIPKVGRMKLLPTMSKNTRWPSKTDLISG